MLYLAIQTFWFLGLTAAVFFGLGYAFHRRYVRAQVVVSDAPPLDPPALRQSNESERTIQELTARLEEKERDLSDLLESMKEAALAPVDEVSPSDLELADRVDALLAELAIKNTDNEALRLETDRLASELVASNGDLSQMHKEFGEAQKKWEENLAWWHSERESWEQDRQAWERASAAWEQERQEWEAFFAAQAAQPEAVASEQTLPIAKDPNTRALEQAVGAIWEDESIEIEAGEPEMDLLFEAPAPRVPSSDENFYRELQARNERMELEFRERIRQLESTIENLRWENEMALMAALEVAESVKGAAPSKWAPPPQVSVATERDAMVDALWKTETDSEKERLRKSVERLRQALDEKEKAIEAMGNQLASLTGKNRQAKVEPDNLEEIKGVGPYTRRMLEREFGIHSFEQLAQLSNQEIEQISERLFFKDKIERENWVGQARALHHKKYKAAS